MLWFYLLGLAAGVLLLCGGAVEGYRRRKQHSAFRQISDALERDIASAEARGIQVNRGESLSPGYRRIRMAVPVQRRTWRTRRLTSGRRHTSDGRPLLRDGAC